MSNNYISRFGVINLNILYRLLVYKHVSWDDYDNIPKARFIRYMSNIKFMFDEFHIYHIQVIYNPLLKQYELLGNL